MEKQRCASALFGEDKSICFVFNEVKKQLYTEP
jgi:hypothetical protein